MPRPSIYALAFLASLVAACSSTSNQAPEDGGTRFPDGSTPDGGAPQIVGDCVDEGYPCSPSEESADARALSDQYMAEVQARMEAGDPMEDIAAWLAAQDDIAHVIGDEAAIRFRVTGGAAMWAYEPPDGVMKPAPESPAAKSKSTAGASPGGAADGLSSVAPKAVLREDGSERNIEKKALFIEPFSEYIATPTDHWRQELLQLHDYDSVHHFINRDVDDPHFGNWNDYRFVWVTTHGKHLPKDDPEYSALFSSHFCKEFGWLWDEIEEQGNGDEPTKLTGSLGSLWGRSRADIKTFVTEAQQARWDKYEADESQEMSDAGTFCGTVKMKWLKIPGQEFDGNNVRTNVPTRYKGYERTWFKNRYPSKLEDVFVYQRACTSDLLDVDIASGSRGAVLGWSDIINSADDDRTIALLFERLIKHGETLDLALKRVNEAGLDSHDGAQNTRPTLSLVASSGAEGDADQIRVRETVSIIDPIVGEPYPDEGGHLDAREVTAERNTIADVTVRIVGFGELEGDEIEKFKLRFYDGSGQPISQEWDVDEPHDGVTFMTIPVSFNGEITSPTEFEIEARVTLPEDSGNADTRHRIKLTVGPAIQSLWSLSVGGGGNARGDFVFAPFPGAIVDGEGRTVWQVSLAQLDELNVPNAILFIVGHNGRDMDCNGATGTFPAIATVIFNADPMPTEGFAGGLGEGECGDSVSVDIESFNKEDDLVATVSGTICHWRRVGMETVVTSVPINGRFQMPSAGCGADPGGDLIGSYYAAEEPSLCFDIYPNAAIAPAFDETCAMGGGLICSEDPCSTAGQIGQCDYTDDSVQITFRGQVQHFGPGGDWPSAGELQVGCELQLGVWTTGEPPPMQ